MMVIIAVVSFQLRIDVERERNDRMGCDRQYSLTFFASLFWAADKIPKLNSKVKITMTIAMAAKTSAEAVTEVEALTEMIFVIHICISVLIIYISHPRYREI